MVLAEAKTQHLYFALLVTPVRQSLRPGGGIRETGRVAVERRYATPDFLLPAEADGANASRHSRAIKTPPWMAAIMRSSVTPRRPA